MDTEEMYRRGLADAESDMLNSFYYQHYYPYRRGYDEMRRRLRRPGAPFRPRRIVLGWLALVLVLIAAAGWYIQQRGQLPFALRPTPTVVVALPTATQPLPTRTPIFPTPTALPTATAVPTAALTVGREALVVTAGLRARRDPKLTSPVVASFRSGDRVKITAGPREADGYTWWKIESSAGAGWSAQRSLKGEEWLRPDAP